MYTDRQRRVPQMLDLLIAHYEGRIERELERRREEASAEGRAGGEGGTPLQQAAGPSWQAAGPSWHGAGPSREQPGRAGVVGVARRKQTKPERVLLTDVIEVRRRVRLSTSSSSSPKSTVDSCASSSSFQEDLEELDANARERRIQAEFKKLSK